MNEHQRKIRTLNDYNNLRKYIDDLAWDYYELFTKATKINQTLHDDTGPANHDNSSKVETMSALLVQKKQRLERAVKKKQRIDGELKKLGVRNEYIVRQAAIERVSLHKVSIQLKKDYKYIIKLYHRLVDRLEI